ncbi:hypothetical protein ACXR2T_10590 [Leucobacter sp. HY1910]
MASVEDSGVDRWFVGGGASHTPESARRQVYTNSGGAEGVGGADDLVVRPLAIPGAGVRVAVGTALMNSRFSGGQLQSYQAAVFREQVVDIPQNDTNKDRWDLVVIRSEDPHTAGSPWPKPAPADIPDEQYIYVRVISNVPASTRKLQAIAGGSPAYANQTGIELALVKVPAMTGTVGVSHITDLREVALPKSETVLLTVPGLKDETGNWDQAGNVAEPAWERWPQHQWYDVLVPEWATQVQVQSDWCEVLYMAPGGTDGIWDARGKNCVRLIGPEATLEVAGTGYNRNPQGANNSYTTNVHMRGQANIPTKLRGQVIRVQMLVSGGKAASGAILKGRLQANAQSQFSTTLKFNEIAVDRAQL